MTIIENEVTDVASLIAKARKVLLGFGQTAYWFRGHACLDWTLVPSVHRDYDSIGEKNLLARFLLAAPTRYAKCPEMKDQASWISLMQHFGLPTRLLDWTGSLLTAAYFAVSHDPQPGPGAIWVLSPGELNLASSHKDSSTFLLHSRKVQSLLNEAFSGKSLTEDIVAVLGQDLDLRMTIQMGAFTIHGSTGPLEARVGAEKYLAKFIIPENAKATLQDELWVLGARRGTLFPDLSNLAQEFTQDLRLIPRRK